MYHFEISLNISGVKNGLRYNFSFILKMWRMAIFIRHIRGEQKNTLGHRCITVTVMAFEIDFYAGFPRF